MCTIIALYGLRRDYPLILATNRDEFYARPATGVARLLDSPVTLGGRDLSAGGTWMGVTREGFMVAITNQRTLQAPRKGTRSRGVLVTDLLRCGEVHAAREHLGRIDVREYSEFNLLFGSAQALWVAYGRADYGEAQLSEVEPGFHVLPNGELDSPAFPKCERARELLEPHLQAPWPELQQRLRDTLADGMTHTVAVPEGASPFFTEELMRRLSALCVHTPSYGTRSSNLVALESERCAYFAYADGPPDEAGFCEVTAMLDD